MHDALVPSADTFPEPIYKAVRKFQDG
jgi:hypothetical protein